MKIRAVIRLLSNLSSITRYSQSILSKPENVLEHTGFVACMSLAIAKELEEQGATIDKGKLLEKALVHDMDEVVTGDIARPTKYSSKEMLDLMDKLSKKAISDISRECEVAFDDHWSMAKKGKEGLIVELSDALSVVYKAYDEVVMRSNLSMNFGNIHRLKPLVHDRFAAITKAFDVNTLNMAKDCERMLDEIVEKLK